METDRRFFLKAVAETFRFEYQRGGVTALEYPFCNDWRTLPGFVLSQTLHARVAIRMKGGFYQEFKEGETFCIAPGVYHRLEMTTRHSGKSRWSHVNFWIFDSVQISSFLDVPLVFTGQRAEKIGEINEELANLQAAREETETPQALALGLHHVFKEKSLALMLISILTEASTFRQQSAAFLKAAKQLVPVLNFIHENLEDDLRREKMAGLIHLSSSAFHSLFKTAIGTSPGEYVQNLRIQKAQQLLISSNLTVNEISQKVGHRDPFHFSKIFKTRCGTSPSFYRDQVRKSLEKSPVKSS